MKVTLLMVASLDGRSTEGSQPGTSSWASPEDQAYFKAQLARHDCIVMGSATYEVARPNIRPQPSRTRIVMTRTPQRYANQQQPGLAFSSADPERIVEQAKHDGCNSLLLLGGAKTSARFFNAGLIDELLVTIEPTLFGAGAPFVAALRATVRLQLVSHRQMNSQGALLAHYIVQKSNERVRNENPKT